jgi:hypothetical protein
MAWWGNSPLENLPEVTNPSTPTFSTLARDLQKETWTFVDLHHERRVSPSRNKRETRGADRLNDLASASPIRTPLNQFG